MKTVNRIRHYVFWSSTTLAVGAALDWDWKWNHQYHPYKMQVGIEWGWMRVEIYCHNETLLSIYNGKQRITRFAFK